MAQRVGLVPGHARALRQKPKHCLIADAPLEPMRLFDCRVPRPLRRFGLPPVCLHVSKAVHNIILLLARAPRKGSFGIPK